MDWIAFCSCGETHRGRHERAVREWASTHRIEGSSGTDHVVEVEPRGRPVNGHVYRPGGLY
jgi:hypothetical protein